MKKIVCLLLSLSMLAALLCACGEKEEVVEEKVFDLEAVYEAVMAAQPADKDPLVLFPETNDEMFEGIYPGIGEIELVKKALYFPPVYGNACEIVLVEVANTDDIAAVQDIFQTRIDKGASDTSYPENAKPWSENAKIHTEGRYVCMIVLPDGYTVPENVFAL